MKKKPSSRRKFIKAGGLGISAAMMGSTVTEASTTKGMKGPNEMTVLFQGDSITDAGRDRSRYYPNDASGMGRGYVFQIVSHLLGVNPDKSWKYYNRGISGNKVFQLAGRWEDDCLQLQPDVLSILIGVNDFWHTLNSYDGTAKIFEDDLYALIERTKKQLPKVKLILGEPFAVQGGSAIDKKWYPEFPKYQQAVKSAADHYGAKFIPYQSIFDKALEVAPAAYWCPDGVHPSMAGAFLMKEAWIEAFNSLL